MPASTRATALLTAARVQRPTDQASGLAPSTTPPHPPRPTRSTRASGPGSTPASDAAPYPSASFTPGVPGDGESEAGRAASGSGDGRPWPLAANAPYPVPSEPYPQVAVSRAESCADSAPTEPLPVVPRHPWEQESQVTPEAAEPFVSSPRSPVTREHAQAQRAPDLPSSRLVRAADGVLEVPTGLKGARVAPPWAAVAGAALIVIVAVAAVLFTAFRADSGDEPVATRAIPAASGAPVTAFTSPPAETGARVIDPSAAGNPVTPAPGPATTVAPAAPATPAAPDVVVHVVGEVRHAGVVSVPAGSRVQDVIKKAGGTTKKAVLSGLNLARPVVDGEQILVPDSEDAPVPVNAAPPPTGAAGGGSAAPSAPIDLNTADQATLEQLDGVGPVLAQRIIEWRTAHGRFTSVDELGEVKGVGDATLEKLRPRVRV